MQSNWPSFLEGVADPFSPSTSFKDPEQLIAVYFNSSTIGFAILDTSLRFLAINDALSAMNGIPAADHLGKTVREILLNFADIVEPKLTDVLLTDEPTQALNHYFPIKDTKGTVRRIGAVVIDITEHRKAKLELREANDELAMEAKRLRMMLEVNNLVSSNWDLTQVFPRISARIRRVLRQEYASLALHDTTGGLLVRHSVDFPLGKGLTRDVQKASEGPSGHVLQARAATIFSREDLLGFGDEARAFLAEGLQCVCCVPML